MDFEEETQQGDDELPPGIAEEVDGELFGGPAVAVNLVPQYETANGEWLDKTCREAIKNLKEDRDSLSDFFEQRATLLELYAGLTQPLKGPAEGGKSAHLAIMCRALLQLVARIWDAVCPSRTDALTVLPVGPEDQEAARRRQKHINWQLAHKIEDWASGHRANITQWLLGGSSFRAKYWDPVKRCTRFDYLTVDEVVISYAEKDVHPLMPRVPRITRIRSLYRHELEEYEDVGHYVNVAALFPKDGSSGEAIGSGLGEDDSPVREVGDRIDGKRKPERRKGQGREIIEQHLWLKLPDQERMKPVILTVDEKTKKPLRLTIREVEDPLDKMRFDAENKAHEAKKASIAKQYLLALQQHLNMNAGVPPEMADPEPPPPPAPKAPRPVRMRTTHEIIHYRCFDNPAGFYGIGVGYLLAGHNELANELSNEYLIAAKLNNRKTALLARGAFPNAKGPIELKLGRMIPTDMDPEELAKGIHEFQFGPPSDGLFKFVSLVREDSESMVASVSQLSGEQGPTNETKAAAQIRNANAMALVSVLAKTYLDGGMTEEVKLIAQDNAIFMDPTEIFWVTEPSKTEPGQQEAKRHEVNRDDYLGEFDFTWTADTRLQTKPEKIDEIRGLIASIQEGPLVNSPVGPPLLDMLYRMQFREMEMPQLESAMGPPVGPPKPPPPPSPMSQVDENAMFMEEKDHPPLPDDDDLVHLQHMETFKAGPFMQRLSPTGKQIFDRHERAHFASLYKKLEAQRGGALVPGQRGVPGMEPGANNGGPPGPPQGAPPTPPAQPGAGGAPGLA